MALPRLCFLSYRAIRQLAQPVLTEYRHRAEIEVVDGSFDRTLDLARERLANDSVDVFVSAGSNASLLRRHLQAPVATIQLTGFDILQALIQARASTERVGLLTYGQTIPELESVKTLLNIEVLQQAYQTPEDARRTLALFKAEGCRVVVGSSLVLELAHELGLTGILAYSLDSIRQGFDNALDLARVRQLESERYAQIHGVLQNLQDAVLAVDREGRLIAANPAMLQALGWQASRPPQGRLDELWPELGWSATGPLQARQSVLSLRQRDWVASLMPWVDGAEVIGATLTLYAAHTIHEADNRLRMRKREEQGTARHHFEDLIGASANWLHAVDEARRFAPTELPVLITGETGTGKELMAQAMHNASARAGRPFVAVNCAAVPEGLLESELFGHEDGAFTGARRGGRRGLFERAHTGTLFLDEIGDLPLPLQSRLLRVLQEGEIQRLGASGAIPVDVRVLAATHRPLQAWVAEGRFRADLFYRLEVLRLELPPLRQRTTDLPVLAHALLERSLRQQGLPWSTSEVLRRAAPPLLSHRWPGNVRELGNLMDRMAVALRGKDTLETVDWHKLDRLWPTVPASGPTERAEQARQALQHHQGRHQDAARALGVSRATLWRWLKDNEATPPD